MSLLVVLLLIFSPSAAPLEQSAPLTASANAAPPPAVLAPPITAKLSKNGVRVVVAKGPVTLDFWWVESLAVKGAGPPSWEGVEEGALVGAISVSAQFRDIRGRAIKPGVYTLRYGIQPQNGDHLGVSPFREFLLISPAAIDTDPAAQGHDAIIDLSKQSIGGSHPGVLSLDPPVAKENPLQLHKTELDHQAVVMEISISRDGKPAGSLRFGLVLIGLIEA